jgi:hypothetical protein
MISIFTEIRMPGLGIDKSEHHRVKRARNAGQSGAQHVGVELDPPCGCAERARRTFGVPDGAKVEPHAAVGHPPGDAERYQQNRQEQIVVRQRGYERDIEYVARHGRPAESDRSAEIRGVGDDQPDEFGYRYRSHAEIMAR